MLRISVEECCNDKSNLFCCFVDFRNSFDIVPRNNLCKRLEELKVPFELRATTIRLYENVIEKLKRNEVKSKDIPPLPYTIWHLHRQARRLFRGCRMCWHDLSWDSHHHSSLY